MSKVLDYLEAKLMPLAEKLHHNGIYAQFAGLMSLLCHLSSSAR